MSAEQNAQIVRRIFSEVVNDNNTGVAAQLIDDNYVNHDMPAPAPGRQGLLMTLDMFRAGFPDFHVTVEDVVASGDKVASRGYFTGTHTGEFMGIPATGKQIKVAYADIWRAENGKMMENWVQLDNLGMLRQLGVAE